MKPELGDEVKCKITGFKGVVNGKSEWLTGCNKVSVQPPVDKAGKTQESFWFDEAAVEVLKKGKVKPASVQESKNKKFGGPPFKSPRF